MAAPSATSHPSRRMVVLAGAGLVLAVLAAYANSFSGPFIFDDLLSIPRNPTIRHVLTSLVPPGGGLTVSGRPVLNLSFALNYALSGDHVWSYHALNLAIHILAGLTLFGIVRWTLIGLEIKGKGVRPKAGGGVDATGLAFAVALLWMLHPLQTESVTYIVQRAESLMGLFYLLTLYCFIRGTTTTTDGRAGPPDSAPSIARAPGRRDREIPHCKTGQSAPGRRGPVVPWSPSPTGWYILAFLACLLGMGTKEVMVSAPVLVLLYDRSFVAGSFRAAWHRRGRVHLALAATWLPLAILVLRGGDRGGTAGFGAGVSFWAYGVTQFQAVAHYLWLSVWPHPLIVDYGVKWVTSAAEVIPYAVVVTLLAVATLVAFVRRPALGYLGLWFFAILSPTSLVPGTRQTLAEHRMYLALAPVMVLVVLAAYTWLGRRGRFVLWAVAAGLAWTTAQRNFVYHSDAGIWHDTVIKRPGNIYARNNYGNILSQAGQLRRAMVQYEAAIRIDPGFANSYFNAGKTLRKLGRLQEAIADFEKALQANPDMPDAQTSLGNALADAGRDDEAIAHYEQALRIDPNYVNAHNSLGLALARAGRLPEAIAQYRKALKINPNLPDAHNNLGNALGATGRTMEAIAQYKEALRLKPDFAAAHNDLGNALRAGGHLPEAIAQYRQALKYAPNVPEVRNNLGVSLLMAGRTEDAITQFEEALRRNPDLGQVHLNLAIALASVGRMQEANEQLAAAKRLGAHLRPLPGPGK